jgi:hypothetical protein
MKDRRIFALAVTITIGLVALAAVMWMSNQQPAHSAAPEPFQGVPSSGGAVSNSSTVVTGSAVFVDIPNMSITTTFIRTGDLLIVFAAESSVSNAATRFQVRCLVDGNVIPPNELTFDSTTTREAHSMSFLAANVGLGTHQIRMQWRQTGGGTLAADERVLSYSNVN